MNRLGDEIKKTFPDVKLLMGKLDVTFYRDDVRRGKDLQASPTNMDFLVEGKKVILIDDVLYTGRTIRCALDALIDFGRPRSIQLAVLVDRGHRELPIRADYAGKNIPTSQKETVQVKITETDGADEVVVAEKEE